VILCNLNFCCCLTFTYPEFISEWFVIVVTLFLINMSVLNANNYINVTLLLKFTHVKSGNSE